jgi:hypothetical protein
MEICTVGSVRGESLGKPAGLSPTRKHEGIATSRGFGASEGPDAEAGRRSKDAGGELSAGEEAVAALS